MAKLHGAKLLNEKDLLRKFNKLSELSQVQTLSGAVYAGGLVIQNLMVEKVPKVSGNLSRSIHIEYTEQTATYVAIAIGTNVAYAARVEFGFNDVDSLGRSYHQPAQPYARPAFLEGKPKAVREIKESLHDVLLALAA